MELACLGLNHTTASVEVRERFAVGTNRLGDASLKLAKTVSGAEGVVVSTCNRTEYYIAAESAEQALSELKKDLNAADVLEESFYQNTGKATAQHLCEVASGMDSMLLGETEIFGQVKTAYKAAHAAGATGATLNKLFQRAFSIGKKVRTSTKIQHGSTSVGNVAVELAEKIFGHLKNSEVMVLGAGEMSRLTAKALVSRGAKSLIVANRTHDRAVELADEMGGRAVLFDNWQEEIKMVDVVISSTGSPKTLIHREEIEAVRRARKYRPLFLIDIAVPRDIDHAVGEIDEVYLYDMDALQVLADQAKERRTQQVLECKEIIESELLKLMP